MFTLQAYWFVSMGISVKNRHYLHTQPNHTQTQKKCQALSLCHRPTFCRSAWNISYEQQGSSDFTQTHTHTHTVSHLKQQLGHLQTHYFILREKKTPKILGFPQKSFNAVPHDSCIFQRLHTHLCFLVAKKTEITHCSHPCTFTWLGLRALSCLSQARLVSHV